MDDLIILIDMRNRISLIRIIECSMGKQYRVDWKANFNAYSSRFWSYIRIKPVDLVYVLLTFETLKPEQLWWDLLLTATQNLCKTLDLHILKTNAEIRVASFEVS